MKIFISLLVLIPGQDLFHHRTRYVEQAECSDLQNTKFSIYLFDNNGKQLKQLTNEYRYEQAPVFVRTP